MRQRRESSDRRTAVPRLTDLPAPGPGLEPGMREPKSRVLPNYTIPERVPRTLPTPRPDLPFRFRWRSIWQHCQVERNAAWRERHVPPWCFPWPDGIEADPVHQERIARLEELRQDVEVRVARGEDREALAQYVESRLSIIWPEWNRAPKPFKQRFSLRRARVKDE